MEVEGRSEVVSKVTGWGGRSAETAATSLATLHHPQLMSTSVQEIQHTSHWINHNTLFTSTLSPAPCVNHATCLLRHHSIQRIGSSGLHAQHLQPCKVRLMGRSGGSTDRTYHGRASLLQNLHWKLQSNRNWLVWEHTFCFLSLSLSTGDPPPFAQPNTWSTFWVKRSHSSLPTVSHCSHRRNPFACYNGCQSDIDQWRSALERLCCVSDGQTALVGECSFGPHVNTGEGQTI